MYILGIDINHFPYSNTFKKNNYEHICIDLRDYTSINVIVLKITEICDKYNIIYDQVYICHLAAKISVSDSMKYPLEYYNSNVNTTLYVLSIMTTINIKNIYFASTAAVYSTIQNISDSNNLKFIESDMLAPSSFYGITKYISETLIESYTKLYNLNTTIFRFFNVAGGRDTDPSPHHLIPILINSLINYNKKDNIDNIEWKIFGNDYDTDDGTCIRDYVHVEDIVNGFILSIINDIKLNKLNINNTKYKIYNLGSGIGYSVMDIINIMKEVIKSNYPNYTIPCITVKERRLGDPDVLIADPTLAYNKLKWSQTKDIKSIIIDTMKDYLR